MQTTVNKSSNKERGGLFALLSSAVLCAFTTFFSAAQGAQGANYKVVEGMVRCGYQQQVATLINQKRAAAGVSAVGFSEVLTDNAMVRAGELAYKYGLSRPNGYSTSSVIPSYNYKDYMITKGQTTPAAAMNTWVDIESAILDSRYTHIGVGCFVRNNIYYWCVLFCDNPGGNPPAVEKRKDDYDATVHVTLVRDPESYIDLVQRGNYKVKFAANGGRGKMAAQTIARNKAVALRKNAFKRKGWIFAGWAKKKNGAVAYSNGAKVKNIAGKGKTVTLYAKWAKKKYKVAFFPNGGTRRMSAQKMTYGKAAKLTANKFKAPKGKAFKGWAKSKVLAKKGKVAYKNKQSVKNLTTTGGTVNLYAVWGKKPKETVTFVFHANASDAQGTMPNLTLSRDEPVGYCVREVYRRPHYALDYWEWRDGPGGGSNVKNRLTTSFLPAPRVFYDSGYRVIHLYAHWSGPWY